MNYCPNCGSNVQPGANVCVECGAQIPQKAAPVMNQSTPNQSYQSPNQSYQSSNQPYTPPPSQSDYHTYNPRDPGGFGWGLLGFCFPFVGLILFLVWQDDKPNNAKAAGTGALVSVGLTVLFYAFAFAAV